MLTSYLKIAVKVLLRRKFFTFISLFAISFTLVILMIGVSFLDSIFAPASPETRLDRTLGIFHLEMKCPSGDCTWSSPGGYKLFDRHFRNLPAVELMSLTTEPELTYSYHQGEKIGSYLRRTDGQFWKIMDFRFIEGRPFTEDDDSNANPVAVINQATNRKFFGEQSAVGRMLEIDGQRFRVVGVVENVPFLRQLSFADIWVPINTFKTAAWRDQLMGKFIALFLARSSADFPAIRQEVQIRLKQVEFPDPKKWNQMYGHAETFFERTSRELTRTRSRDESRPYRAIALIVGAMILFMLLPTVNLININVSRIMERAGEIGVRKSFGASSWTLVGQFIIENILLTLIGGAIGLVLSQLALDAIARTDFFPYSSFQLNYRVFLYGLALAIFFGLLSGVYPAWRMSRLHPVEALRGAVSGGVR